MKVIVIGLMALLALSVPDQKRHDEIGHVKAKHTDQPQRPINHRMKK